MDYPTISVVVPVRNEEKYISRCVETIFRQDYPRDRMDVIFVDGQSNDRTVQQLLELQNTYPEIRLLENPHRTVPYAMNIGIRASRAEVIVRLDAHAEYPPDYVRLSVETLLTRECENVGGYCDTRGRGFVGEGIAAMLCTPFGVGNSTFRTADKDGYVDTVAFGCFHRDLFERIGYYDERMTRNQDNELSYRIRKNGGKIWFNHRIRFVYYCRDTLSGILRMGFMNGKWNVITMALVPGSMSLRHFVPFAFVLSTLLLLALVLATGSFFFKGLLLLEWGMYLALDLFYAWDISQKKGLRYLPLEVFLFPAFHFAYGTGSFFGLLALPSFLKDGAKRKNQS